MFEFPMFPPTPCSWHARVECSMKTKTMSREKLSVYITLLFMLFHNLAKMENNENSNSIGKEKVPLFLSIIYSISITPHKKRLKGCPQARRLVVTTFKIIKSGYFLSPQLNAF